MAANNASREIREWLRSEGHEVSSRGALPQRLTELYYDAHPHLRPAGGVRLLPGPDATDEDLAQWEDMGEIGPESDPEPLEGPGGPEIPAGAREPARDDAGPAHARKEWRKAAKGKTRPGPVRVTASIRGDIDAKVRFALTVPGAIWQARDPMCGGTFVQQAPEIADALTDIICDSADLVAFFAGPGGNFMKALKLGAALMPVIQVVAAHHVYHSIDAEPADPVQPDYGQYAA